MKARAGHSTPGPDGSGAVPAASSELGSTTDVALPCMDEGTLERLTEVVDRTQSVTSAPVPPALPRAPYLVVLSGDHEGRVIKLPDQGTFVIGRAETCDFSLEDDGISRQHARIVASGGKVHVEDLGSRNGTFIGPQAIERQRLIGDEIIRLGARTALKFSLMDSVEEDYLRRLLAAALKDPLTGLYNRRHFDERIATACAAANRHGETFSLVLGDIDNFKQVNDTHGHPAGDAALRAVADLLLGGARREDEVFRYGGEEFALLMRSTPGKGACEVAERMRKAVEQTPVTTDNAILQITLSLGVAEYAPGDDITTVFSRADKALYDAKRGGKNRVVGAP